MKKSGRNPVPLTEEKKQAVELYFNSDLGLNQVAEKYNTTKSGLQYWINKYRKEKENAEKNYRGEEKSN